MDYSFSDKIRTAIQEAVARQLGMECDDIPKAMEIGKRFGGQMLSGHFDDSPVGRFFGSWFAEEPIREGQRATFVEIARGVGAPDPRILEALLECLMREITSDRPILGDLLATELDHLFVQEAPRTPDEAVAHTRGAQAFQDLKTWLRRQDVIQEAVREVASEELGMPDALPASQLRRDFQDNMDALGPSERLSLEARLGERFSDIWRLRYPDIPVPAA